MKICYIANSKSYHTLSFAKYFINKGNEIIILDHHAKENKIINGKIHVFSLIEPNVIVERLHGQSDIINYKKNSLVYIFNSYRKKLTKYFEISYAFLMGYFIFILRLPKFLLYKSENSELFQLERFAIRTKQLINDFKPDIVHASFLTSYGYIAARTGFKPLVISAMGSDVLLRPKEDFISRMKLLHTIAKSNLITFNSKILSKSLERYGANISKLKEVYWGVDTEIFYPINNIDLHPTIIHTRSLDEVYNVGQFLDAIPIVKKSISNVTVIMKSTGALKNDVELKIKTLKLNRIVRLIDSVSQDVLASYFRKSHVYISVSISDSTSVALLEAMASGCFPIVSDIPANQEWIKDGVNGFLVDLHDPKMLGDRIIQAFDNRVLRDKAAKQNVETIKARAEWKDQVKNLEEYYYQLINDVTI